jgi:putative flippase GtrA
MVEKTKSLLLFLYSHSFVRYVAVGGTTFALDFFLLVFLHGVLGVNVLVAASVSYWVSITYNFLVNRFWTFSASEKSELARHLMLYLLLLGFNYLFTIAFLAVAGHFGMHYTIAKVLAVAIQMSWTYVTYKKVIFT